MSKFAFTAHARDMLTERKIPEDWGWRALNQPDEKQLGKDGNMHYTKSIIENNGHVLHVIVNPNSDKPKPKRESRTRYGLPKARETG